MKKIYAAFIAISLTALPNLSHAAYPTSGTAQTPYCAVPPYLAQSVKPFIHFVLDYSGSMNESVYVPTSSTKYTSTTNYYGYFDSDKYYKYKNGYFSVNTSCTNTNRIGKIDSGDGCISGNLLNWISTSRVDVLRKILTGGKVYSGNILQSESSNNYTDDTTLDCEFTVFDDDPKRLNIKKETWHSCALFNCTGSCENKTFDLRVDTGNSPHGLLHDIYGKADLILSTFSDRTSYPATKNAPLADFLNAVNNTSPNGSTYSGEALTFAQKYFSQADMKYCTNPSTRICSQNSDCDREYPFFGPRVCENAPFRSSILGVGDVTKDPYYDSGPKVIPCKKSFVMLISDGLYNGEIDPKQPAYTMNTTDLRTDITGSQTVATYTLYAFGNDTDGTNSMKTTALFGGFVDKDGNKLPYPFSNTSGYSENQSYPITQCNPSGTWNSLCAEWDTTKKGLPYNYFEGSNGFDLQEQMQKAFSSMISAVGSGTAASIGGAGSQSTGIILQTMFMPSRWFGNTLLSWVGEMQGLWYYIDPMRRNAYINFREDTNKDYRLKLSDDRIVEYSDFGATPKAKLFTDANADGTKDSTIPSATVDVELVNTLLWAGSSLWTRKPADRAIYTNLGNVLTNFTAGNSSSLKAYLDVSSNDADTQNIINYVRGYEDKNCSSGLPADEYNNNLTGYRCRTAQIGAQTHAWKLSDIINSAPVQFTGGILNSYDAPKPAGYSDATYQNFVNTTAYISKGMAFVGANDGMLHAFKQGRTTSGPSGYIASLKNPDGTAPTDIGKEEWAFIPFNALPYLKHLGNPEYRHLYYVDSTPYLIDASIGFVSGTCSGTPQKGCLSPSDCGGSACNPTSCSGPDCPRTYNKSWLTILFGSMGMGGATREYGATCPECYRLCSNDSTKRCAADTDCVSPGKCTAIETCCVKSPVANTGYSSYFALDVTAPTTPKIIGELATPLLGYSTSGVAMVRQNYPQGNKTNNGRWFGVFASGPTGPIDPITMHMKGYSDQPLRILVVDLSSFTDTSGSARKFEMWTFSNENVNALPGMAANSHIYMADMPSYAFAGTITNSTVDTDKPRADSDAYSDDAIYIGYTRKDTKPGSASVGKFAKGGVLRLLTGDDPNPKNWKVHNVIKDIGPVTTSVVPLNDFYKGDLWLFFGTGRLFHKNGDIIDDDYTGQQEAIYGIKDQCYTSGDFPNINCSTEVTNSISDIKNQTSSPSASIDEYKGWKIMLEQASGTYAAERIITSPWYTATGTVFFASTYPYSGVCSYNSETAYWQVQYNSGTAPGFSPTGQIIHQSTNSVTQIDISTDFNDPSNPGRKTIKYSGGGASGGNQISASGASTKAPKYYKNKSRGTPSPNNANHTPVKEIIQIREH